jgi:hypothetical protein
MGSGMMVDAPKKSDKRSRLVNILVILICLLGAIYCVIMFGIDLRSLDSIDKNQNPVGTIIIGNDIVQRRTGNRTLWDRLTSDSPVYSGDEIRTADVSNATLFIGGNSIDLNEKTAIRLQRSPQGGDSILISLEEGNLVITTASGGGNIVLNLMGRQLETGPLTVLSASVGKDGAVVQVSEGTATLVEGGQRREISSGKMIAMDSGGVEQMLKSAVMLQPRPGARYLKDGPQPLLINFVWNSVNLDSGETICLELTDDRNFNRVIHVIENLDTSARVALNAGIWYWRLSLRPPVMGAPPAKNTIISTGRLTVADASGPTLLSPATDSLFRYQDKLPQLRFQWSEIAEASSYILEASQTQDFIDPRLRTQTDSAFFFDSGLGPGTWYWRVMPVFPPVYEGSATFSTTSFFRIEQGGTAEQVPGVFVPVSPELALLLPEPQNRLPSEGHRIGIEQLSKSNSIVFSWSAVQGANAYIITLYQATESNPDTGNRRRQIIRVPPLNRRNWTLENLAALGRGTFIWQVEAVNMSATGTIERRGKIGENSFVIDIPQPGRVQIENSETLYGN